MTDRSVDPRTRAGVPVAFAAGMERVRRSRRTDAELVEAIREDERRLGRSMSQGEREAFARGFHGEAFVEELRLLAAHGRLDDGDDEDDEG